MRLKRIKIRGAIGLKPYGDEIEINLDREFDPGLIAIVGENGAGKTTLLEIGFHPWPKMLSYGGKFATNFYLKDSLKEIEFDYADHSYLSKTFIDAENEKVEAYLYRDNFDAESEPLNKSNGTTEYKKICDELFGSAELFFKAIFSFQGSEGIAKMATGNKQADITDFVMRLFDMSQYGLWEKAAKKKAEAKKQELSTASGERNSLKSIIDGAAERIAKRPEIETAITEIEQGIEKLESDIAITSADIELARKEAEDRRQLNQKYSDIGYDYTQLTHDKKAASDLKSVSWCEFDIKINQLSAEIGQLEASLANADNVRAEAKKLVETEKNKERLDIVKNLVAELQAKFDGLTATTLKINDLAGDIKKVKTEIESLKKQLESSESLKSDLARLQELESKIDKDNELNKEICEIEAKRDRLIDKRFDYNEGLKKDIARYEGELANAKSLAGNLDIVPCKDTPDFVKTCPMIEAARTAETSSGELASKIAGLKIQLEAPLAYQLDIDAYNREVEALEVNHLSLDDKAIIRSEILELRKKNLPDTIAGLAGVPALLDEKNKQLEALNQKLSAITPIDTAEIESLSKQIFDLNFDPGHYNRVLSSLEELRKRDLSKQISDLDKAVVTIEERKRQKATSQRQRVMAERDHDQRLAAIQDKIDAKFAETEAIKIKIDEPLKYKLGSLQTDKVLLESDLSKKRTSLGESRGALTAIDQLIKDNKQTEQKLTELDLVIKTMESYLSDCYLLANALGKTGIQSLEINAAGPTISGIATQMIREFGRDWVITISTENGFDILVATPEGIKNFDKLSGGQKVWIEVAIRQAVITYLIKYTGRDYSTIVQDEMDGALDPDRAMAFFETAKKVCEITGAKHLILITHRPEIWQQIQRIHLHPDEGRIEMVRS